MMSSKTWGPLACGVAVMLCLARSQPLAAAEIAAADDQPAMQVAVDAVRQEPLAQTVPVIGRFVARQSGVVAARIGGPVGEIRVEVGDRVGKGDVIAVLVKDLLRARQELLKAEADQYASVVTTRQAEIELRQQELRRIEKLKQSAAFSKARLDDKRQEVVVGESQLAEAEARWASARANLKLTEINLSYATVRAPYSGVVSKRHTEVGSFVNIGEPLITLIDDNNMEIEADVPANRTTGLKPGTVILVDLMGGRRIESEVRAVVPEENSQTRTRVVRFLPKLGDNSGSLAANQTVTLHVPAGAMAKVTTVHKDAILTRNGMKLVFVVGAGKAEIRPVSLGEAVGNRFVVLKGLKDSDLVVVRGNERLRPGQSVSHPGQATPGQG